MGEGRDVVAAKSLGCHTACLPYADEKLKEYLCLKISKIVVMSLFSYLRQTFSKEVVENIGRIANGVFKIRVWPGLQFTLAN